MEFLSPFILIIWISGIISTNVKLNYRGAGLPLQCITQEGHMGTCQTVSDCHSQGGQMSVRCAQGAQFGVCCVNKNIGFTNPTVYKLQPQDEDYDRETNYDEDSYGEYGPLLDSAVTQEDYEYTESTLPTIISQTPSLMNKKPSATPGLFSNSKFPLSPAQFAPNRARSFTSATPSTVSSSAVVQVNSLRTPPPNQFWKNFEQYGSLPDLTVLFGLKNFGNKYFSLPGMIRNRGPLRTTFDIPIKNFNLGEVCGKPVIRMPKIYGGTSALLGEFPWQASLRSIERFSSVHKCGAVLLHPKWVITAAHCASQIPMERMVVRTGDIEIDNDNSTHTFRDSSVKRIIIHPNYSYWYLTNDIALLELSSALPLRSNIIPICLPPQQDFSGKLVTLTGWGRVSSDGPLLKTLHKVQAPVLSNKECESMFRKAKQDRNIEEQLICTGYPEGGKDACEGDSGGPVQLEKNGRWILIAVISWGVDCGHPNQPGASTLIPKFTNWITESTDNEVYVT